MGPLKSHYTPLYVHLHKMHSCWYYHEHFTWLLSKSIRLYRAALERQDACGMPMLCQYALPLIPQGEALIQCPYPWPDLITEHYLISFCSAIKWTIKSQIKCKLDYIQATPPPPPKCLTEPMMTTDWEHFVQTLHFWLLHISLCVMCTDVRLNVCRLTVLWKSYCTVPDFFVFWHICPTYMFHIIKPC